MLVFRYRYKPARNAGVIPQAVMGRVEMWGWKSIERFVSTDVGLDSAREVLSQKGYEILQETDGAIFMKKPGTQFTMQGQEMPVEIAVAADTNGLFLQARYASFVLFDTGDLGSHLNDIVNEMGYRLTSIESDPFSGFLS